jgi:glycosyltransferase involved in cell wall biosynthesis
MTKEKHLLFYGELPPVSVHGVAISNKINLDILKSAYTTDIIEELALLSEHDKNSLNKIAKQLKNIFRVFSKSVSRSYDYFYLVYSTSFFGSFKTLAAILCFRASNRGKVVLHIHRGDFFNRYYKSLLNKIISRIIFNLSHQIVVLSRSQENEFKIYFRKSYYVLRNTVEYEYGKSDRKRGHHKFICITNYLIEKGIVDLLDVFSRISKTNPEIYLSTYGDFSDSELKESILKYSSKNIWINGLISGSDKFREIANSDCLILPSWNEGQPTVLLEAMSVGTPVIATQTGLIPEMLGFDYPFISVPGDRISLESKIIEFIQYKDMSTVSNMLYERYNESYSQKKHIEMLNNIFG